MDDSRFDERFEQLRKLGEGGMGSVVLARDRDLDRQVAIKFLQGDDWGGDILERFFEEAKILTHLSHANIVSFYDYGIRDDLPYLVLEYVTGQSLHDILRSGNCLPHDRFFALAEQLCGAMSYAHAKGVLHRDLKSDNVMVNGEGQLKILDFGLAKRGDRRAKLTATGVILGTPSYISPEQAMGKAATMASDIYSSGILFYEMLSGQLPFVRDTLVDLLKAHSQDAPPPLSLIKPDLPRSLGQIIDRALEKKPADRPPSFATFWEDLAKIRKALPTEASASQADILSHSMSTFSRTIAPTTTDLPTQAKSPKDARETEMLTRAIPKMEDPGSPPTQLRRGFRSALGLALLVSLVVLACYHFTRGPSWTVPLEIQLRAHGAVLSGTSSRPRRLRYELHRGETVLFKGEEEKPVTAHRILLRGLRPKTRYTLRLRCNDHRWKRDLITAAPKLESLAFACALEGRLYLDFSSNVEKDLTVEVRRNGIPVAMKRLRTGQGPVMFTSLPTSKEELPYRWFIRYEETLLGEGCTPQEPRPMRNSLLESHGQLKDLAPFTLRPLWHGEQVFTADEAGVVSAYRLNRGASRHAQAPMLRRAWQYLLPCQNLRRPKVRHIGGLVVTPRGRLFFLNTDDKGRLHARILDLDARNRAAQLAHKGDPPRRPPSVFDDWEASIEEKKVCLPEGLGLLHEGLIYVGVTKCNSESGWFCFDPAERRMHWKAMISFAHVKEQPCHAWSKGGGWLSKPPLVQNTIWSMMTNPVIVDGSLFAVIHLGRKDGTMLSTRALVTCPADKTLTEGDLKVCFCFQTKNREAALFADHRKRTIWLTTQNTLYRWPVGSTSLPETINIEKHDEGLGASYFTGSPLRLGDTLHVLQASPRVKPGVRTAIFRGAYIPHDIHWLSWNRSDDGGTQIHRFHPSLFLEADDRAPEVWDFRVAGNCLVGHAQHKLFVLDPKRHRYGLFQRRTFSRMSKLSHGPHELVSLACSDGNLYVLPFRLILAAGMRVTEKAPPRRASFTIKW